MNTLEDEIRALLMKEEKSEMITGDFRISVRENGHVEISELPPLNLEQLKLPLAIEPEESEKGEKT